MSTRTSITADAFRVVMGSVASAVAAVSTFGERPHATTVSAFMSLSMDPPMVVVSLDRSSDLLRHVTVAQRFGVSVLASRQAGTAIALAGKGVDKLATVPWHVDAGLPRIDGASGWLACEVASMVEGGDQVLVLGRVMSLDHTPNAPLTYRRGMFGTHVDAGVEDA
ncbi:flavin oxidoreductase [Actinomycetospora sp. NBRC 106375]|uniref:flavin reductase family protein n=1 Tax=Actinomycetospora sp. NBRC 106375 TaxID=3032207 RepID=UPI0024A30CFC|nr:flavin reductase family protein [Actinomycetospora sp. NBRC 106375]GLZ49728.1 flavin oxidoreductase [Actinomycetospora sp. NBRC 106375]